MSGISQEFMIQFKCGPDSEDEGHWHDANEPGHFVFNGEDEKHKELALAAAKALMEFYIYDPEPGDPMPHRIVDRISSDVPVD